MDLINRKVDREARDMGLMSRVGLTGSLSQDHGKVKTHVKGNTEGHKRPRGNP
jgi:hypothetical protein